MDGEMDQRAELRKPTRAPTRDGVTAAASRIAEILPPTPLLPVELDGSTLWAKAECLQPVGAFKIRGAWNRLVSLPKGERERGVVAVSSGNHAQGVAWAARELLMPATIIMPSDAPRVKMDRVREMGAQIVEYDRMKQDREAIAMTLCDKRACAYVHAFADPWVIEGQGSAGVELAGQMNRQAGGPVERIVTCCGGGGLASGLALACPDAEIVTVEPEGWDDVARSLADGVRRSVGENPPTTACDALQTFATFKVNFDVMRAHDVRGIWVSEAETRAAQRYAFERLRLVLEPGGAVALAAMLSGKLPPGPRTAVMLTGGNVDPASFASVLAGE
ncbi:Phenylserine dehydratase [Paraurantiacibacter namhicola]|uniref:Phenylserine dehydratase n=2 Tax=Paraurantiacibacter namhicola TaxID=645517 RepID=A0A1C7D9Q5_9SPHN|nr:Phenylserine dehydratase [Paraurantiacibacter namhicola]